MFLILSCCFLSVRAQRLDAKSRWPQWPTSRQKGKELPQKQVGSAPSAKSTDSGPRPKSVTIPGTRASTDSPTTTSQEAKPEELFSPSIARKFYEIAYELANSKDVSGPEAEQAIVFLTATVNLDTGADYAHPLLIKVASRYAKTDYSTLVYHLLVNYVDESADLEVVRDAIRYLLERLDSREQRERLLQRMLKDTGKKNTILFSELVTLLGVFAVEKADLETAKFYFMQAYNSDKYNKLAFAKLAELMPEQVGPALYLEQLRLAIRENPADIEAALNFAQYAERLQLYEAAADAYKYCADLFEYLYPSEALPPNIYLPWAISCYNSQSNQHKCLQIADKLRQSGRFDLLLEAIAGRAAAKIGDAEQATRIFQDAEDKAQQLLRQGPRNNTTPLITRRDEYSHRVGAKEFAWFYCFALPDDNRALDWANKAYAIEPNSATAAALLAYSLMRNQQIEWAKPLIENYQRNQIADLTLAQIQLTKGQRDLAIRNLNSAIAKDPGSLAAELAKEILTKQGTVYIPPVDTDVVLATLKNSFDQTLVPEFIPPEEIISVQFNLRGNKFSYSSNFDAAVAITNNSSEPLVIGDDGLFKGNIRVDANVSGNLNKKIPNLVSLKTRTASLIEPGRSILIPLQLITGELKWMLLAHPQASLDIEFTLYLDPVTTDLGGIANRLSNIQPARVLVRRPAIKLNAKYLRTRFNSISTGQLGQKIKTAQLFIGLLMEQYAMSNRKPLYRFMYGDWMPTMLKSALIHQAGLLRNPADTEWLVKVHTMAGMLSLPLDQELTSAVAENLNNTHWPVRLMAVYLLAKSPDSKFAKVLDWTAKYDQNKLVRAMATALAAADTQAPEPANLPPPDEPDELSLINEK